MAEGGEAEIVEVLKASRALNWLDMTRLDREQALRVAWSLCHSLVALIEEWRAAGTENDLFGAASPSQFLDLLIAEYRNPGPRIGS